MKFEASREEGIMLDTTGSVVYTGEEICRRMQNLTTVVYLAGISRGRGNFDRAILVRPQAGPVGRPIFAAPGRIRAGRRRALLSATDRAPKETVRAVCAPHRSDGTPAEHRILTRADFSNFSTRRRGPRDEIPKHASPQSGGLSARRRPSRIGARRRTVHAGRTFPI